MGDIQHLTVYFHAAYFIAGLLYAAYIASLAVRARRAAARPNELPPT
jgi:hypothetical protein